MYLVHAVGVEPHDGRVRQSVEDLARGQIGVHVVRLEQLGHEVLVVHGLDDILQH